MQSLQHAYLRLMQRLLPSPLALAILLSLLTFVLAWFVPDGQSIASVSGYWYAGFWELLGFSMQMVLILVLGHTLALSSLIQRLIDRLAQLPASSASAAALVCFLAVLAGIINWGLCLIVGALLARQLGERNPRFNYPLLASAGYAGMMVWHGGLSGSAPLVVAQKDHFLHELIGQVAVDRTLFATPNLLLSVLLLLVLPLLMYWLGKRQAEPLENSVLTFRQQQPQAQEIPTNGSKSLDQLRAFSGGLGLLFIVYAVYLALAGAGEQGLGFLSLNYINFLLFGLCLLMHRSLASFSEAIQEAISGASGIIVQFPLYAGIMGLMKYSGLVSIFSSFFIEIASADSLPFYTFLSAALINFFVPSGGGQWAVQGPIMLEAAQSLQLAPEKVIMALAYGDGLTNMLQPFWALPLLGITKLQARDILPYTAIIFLAGLLLYSAGIWLFW